MSEEPLVNRDTVREIACPMCAAPAGEPCRGTRGDTRAANHTDRVAAWQTQARASAVTRRPYDINPPLLPPPATDAEKARTRPIIDAIRQQLHDRGKA